MSVIEKSEILSLVAGSGLPRRRALAQLGLAKSTYYRWLRRQTGGSLQDRKGGSPVPWNKLRPEEEEMILDLARAFPLYTIARLMGDVNAVKKGKVGKRVARRAAGKATVSTKHLDNTLL